MFGANTDVISFLLENCPSACKRTDKEGMTPLHLLCDSDEPNAAAVKLLLEENATVCSIQTKVDGSTPLHLAVLRKAPVSVLNTLIEAEETALSTKDDRGRIPLFSAVAVKADLETFKLLLHKYPDGRETKNKLNELPCMFAARMVLNDDILQLLAPP